MSSDKQHRTRLGRTPLDRKLLALLYEKLGDDFLHKGDYLLAEKFYIQTDICNPNNEANLEKIEFVRRQKENATESVAEDEDSVQTSGQKFHFICVPMIRCGSTHYSTLLPIHPEIYVVPKTELDIALQNSSEPQLLHKYWRRTLRRRPDLRVGLVQHSFIAGVKGPPDIAKRLSEIVATDGFIQGVRDPFELAKSMFNHDLITRFGGSYKFEFTNPNTPFSARPIELREITNSHFNAGYYDNRSFSVDPDDSQRLLEELLSQVRYYAVGKTYTEFFDGWRAIDMTRSANDVVGGRMAEVFDAIGARSDYQHPMFSIPHANALHRVMVQNMINLKVYNSNITLFLGISGQSLYSSTFDFVELFWMEPDDQCLEVGIRHPICLCMPASYWSIERRDICHRMVEDGFAERFMREYLVPLWIANYKAWKKTIHPFLIHEIDRTMRARMFDDFGDDLSEFLNVHPHFADIWPSVPEFLGA